MFTICNIKCQTNLSVHMFRKRILIYNIQSVSNPEHTVSIVFQIIINYLLFIKFEQHLNTNIKCSTIYDMSVNFDILTTVISFIYFY